jgi:pimeloyl-ACP methyl ester carboxylesterase
MATGALNWYSSLAYLGHTFRVVAPDLRGHGRMGRGGPPFSLDGCARDLASLEDQLEVEQAVVVGYSMGGAIAQVFAARYPQRARGIVLCATAASFARQLKLRPAVRVAGWAGATAVRQWPDAGQHFLAWRIARHDQATAARRARSLQAVTPEAEPARRRGHPDWALEERTGADLAAFIEAGAELNAYDASQWLPLIKVPAAVIVTERDTTVPPWRQEAMAELLPHARRYRVDAGHDAVVAEPGAFLPVLREACTKLAG